MADPIYLDNQATTPLDPEVMDAMLPFFHEKFGNASSIHHSYGLESKKAVEKSRQVLSDSIKANKREIIFTSGATEAINLAIKGVAGTFSKKHHMITQATEHSAVLDTFKSPLSVFFPNIELILYNLFETIKDIYLFIKNLLV